MASRIQVRRGNATTDWQPIQNSVPLAAGEPAIATGDSKGPLLYFGDGTTTFVGLKAQMASFTPHTGSNTRYGHVTATDQDYTFTMLAAGDNARALGMASGGSLTFKSGSSLALQSGSSLVVDDTATVDFDTTPDFNRGARIFVGLDDNDDGVTEQGSVAIKRDSQSLVTVSQEGDVFVQPFNVDGVTQTNLKIKQSSADDTAFDVLDSNASRLFRVNDNNVRAIPEVSLGELTNHTVPVQYARIKSATNPDITDDLSLTNFFNTTPHFILKTEGGSKDNVRGKLVLTGNRDAGTGQTALQICKNGIATSALAADYGGNIAITGQLTAQKYVVPNHPCQVRITQTAATASYNLRGNTSATAISFTRITQLAVSIAPASTSSKILIEVSAMGGDGAIVSTADRPEALIGTLFRKKNSGSHVDLSAANSSGVVRALFFNTCTRFDPRGNVSAANNIVGQYLDTPTYTLGDTLTYSLGLATFVDSASDGDGTDYKLNLQDDNQYHNAQASSLIKVTEIPQ